MASEPTVFEVNDRDERVDFLLSIGINETDALAVVRKTGASVQYLQAVWNRVTENPEVRRPTTYFLSCIEGGVMPDRERQESPVIIAQPTRRQEIEDAMAQVPEHVRNNIRAQLRQSFIDRHVEEYGRRPDDLLIDATVEANLDVVLWRRAFSAIVGHDDERFVKIDEDARRQRMRVRRDREEQAAKLPEGWLNEAHRALGKG